MLPLLFIHALAWGETFNPVSFCYLCFISLGVFFVITLVLWIYSYFFAKQTDCFEECYLILVPREEVVEESSVRTEKAGHCAFEEIVTGCLALHSA